MISVIIPVLNERPNIRNCIDVVLSEGADLEVIVCDGGSTDGTAAIVETYRDRYVTLLQTPKGRGTQMNAGASAAKGDILLFLHGDTRLEKGWHDAVLRALEDPAVAAGAFTLRIDNPKRHYRLIESVVKCRCRIFKLPYGDQALFMKRKVFEKIGGYRNIPLMEDIDIAERLKGAGRVVILGEGAVTDARRWEREGWLCTSARNHFVRCLYRSGFDPNKLARIYYR